MIFMQKCFSLYFRDAKIMDKGHINKKKVGRFWDKSQNHPKYREKSYFSRINAKMIKKKEITKERCKKCIFPPDIPSLSSPLYDYKCKKESNNVPSFLYLLIM